MAQIAVRCHIVSTFVMRVRDGVPEFLLMRRRNPPAGAWCQVAGKIEDGETAWQAALRELHEETGLMPDTLHSADTFEQFYEPARDQITIAPVFVAMVPAQAQVVLNAEHDEYRWVTAATADELLEFTGQRRVLAQIVESFISRAPSRHLRIAFGD